MNISTINVSAKWLKEIRKGTLDIYTVTVGANTVYDGRSMEGAILMRNNWNKLVPTHNTKCIRVHNDFMSIPVVAGIPVFSIDGRWEMVYVRISPIKTSDGIQYNGRTYRRYKLAQAIAITTFTNDIITYNTGDEVWASDDDADLDDKNILVCKNCGELIRNDKWVVTDDTEHIFCEKCKDKAYVMCDECHEWVENFRTTDNDSDRHICDGCYENLDGDNKFFVCDDCGELIYDRFGDKRYYIDSTGNLVCQACRDDHYVWCCECETYVHEDDAHWIDSVDDYVCDSCLDDHYVQCYHCDQYFREGSGEGAYDMNDDFYCDHCIDNGYGEWDDDDDDDDYALRGYHSGRHDCGGNVGTYGMDFLTYGSREDNPVMGIENEIDEGGESSRNARQIRDEIGECYVICSEDGSLANGFELVSCPSALHHHMNTIGWKAGFRKAIDLGYTSHNNGRCGLHIHIDRGYDNSPRDTVENNYIILFRNNLWWLKAFSRRDDYNPNRSEPWYYCQPNGEGVLNDEDILDGESVKNKRFLKSMKGRGHYVAMNMEHENTIELRFFRGTLRYTTFIATLQLVDMWARLIKGKEEEEVARITLESFIEMAHEREYDEFLRYIDERHITEMDEPKRKLVRYTETEDIHYVNCY